MSRGQLGFTALVSYFAVFAAVTQNAITFDFWPVPAGYHVWHTTATVPPTVLLYQGDADYGPTQSNIYLWVAGEAEPVDHGLPPGVFCPCRTLLRDGSAVVGIGPLESTPFLTAYAIWRLDLTTAQYSVVELQDVEYYGNPYCHAGFRFGLSDNAQYLWGPADPNDVDSRVLWNFQQGEIIRRCQPPGPLGQYTTFSPIWASDDGTRFLLEYWDFGPPFDQRLIDCETNAFVAPAGTSFERPVVNAAGTVVAMLLLGPYFTDPRCIVWRDGETEEIGAFLPLAISDDGDSLVGSPIPPNSGGTFHPRINSFEGVCLYRAGDGCVPLDELLHAFGHAPPSEWTAQFMGDVVWASSGPACHVYPHPLGFWDDGTSISGLGIEPNTGAEYVWLINECEPDCAYSSYAPTGPSGAWDDPAVWDGPTPISRDQVALFQDPGVSNNVVVGDAVTVGGLGAYVDTHIALSETVALSISPTHCPCAPFGLLVSGTGTLATLYLDGPSEPNAEMPEVHVNGRLMVAEGDNEYGKLEINNTLVFAERGFTIGGRDAESAALTLGGGVLASLAFSGSQGVIGDCDDCDVGVNVRAESVLLSNTSLRVGTRAATVEVDVGESSRIECRDIRLGIDPNAVINALVTGHGDIKMPQPGARFIAGEGGYGAVGVGESDPNASPMLAFPDGGDLIIGGSPDGGSTPNADGLVRLIGHGQLTGDPSVRLGISDGANGQLWVQDWGAASIRSALVGAASGGSGTITVEGPDSRLWVNGTEPYGSDAALHVGYAGTGTLRVENGAAVVAQDVEVGVRDGAVGNLYVVDASLTAQALVVGLRGETGAAIGGVNVSGTGVIGCDSLILGPGATVSGQNLILQNPVLCADRTDATLTARQFEMYAGATVAVPQVTVEAGAEIAGDLFPVDLPNAGLVRPAGAERWGPLAIAGNYAQSPAGVLECEMVWGLGMHCEGGGEPSDSLVVDGGAALDGTLRLVIWTDFAANRPLVTAAAGLTGRWSRVELANPVFGKRAVITYDAAGAYFSLVDAPSCPGDVDYNSVVTAEDLIQLIGAIGGVDSSAPDPSVDPFIFAASDVDGDGDVDLADFAAAQVSPGQC